MKRPLAFALTIVVFAVIAVCFLRPINENPDFGNVPKVAGYGCFEEITDCTGDTDLLTIDAIDWSRSTDGSAVVRTTPTQFLVMESEGKGIDGASFGKRDKRGLSGFAEKKVGVRWESVGEIWVGSPNGTGVMQSSGSGGEKRRSGCSLSPNSGDYFRETRVELPEYDYGATYRLTYFFLEVGEDGRPYDEVHSLSHTVTLPKKSNKRLDFVSLGWEETTSSDVYPEIRVNHGEVPYLSLYDCTLEHEQDGQWVESTWKGKSAFFLVPYVDGITPIVKLEQCKNLENHYRVPRRYSLFISNLDGTDSEHPPTDYRLTLVFCDNADGSGERYTLTLYLNTELLAEYK